MFNAPQMQTHQYEKIREIVCCGLVYKAIRVVKVELVGHTQRLGRLWTWYGTVCMGRRQDDNGFGFSREFLENTLYDALGQTIWHQEYHKQG